MPIILTAGRILKLIFMKISAAAIMRSSMTKTAATGFGKTAGWSLSAALKAAAGEPCWEKVKERGYCAEDSGLIAS